MSVLCHKRTSAASFDHIVGATEQQRWHVEVQRLGGLEIDDQFKLCRRLDREVGRLLALEDAVDVLWHEAIRYHDEAATRIARLCGNNPFDLILRVNRSVTYLNAKGRCGGLNGRHQELERECCCRVEQQRHA